MIPAPRAVTTGPDDSVYLLDNAGRPNWNGRLVDQNRTFRQCLSDITYCCLDEGQIGRAVRVLWCRHTQERDLTSGYRSLRTQDETQSTTIEPLSDKTP